MDEYYLADGARAVGPHSLRELQELYSMAAINTVQRRSVSVAKQAGKLWALSVT